MKLQICTEDFAKLMKEITSDGSRRNKITTFYVRDGKLHVALYGVNRSINCIGDCEDFALTSYDNLKKILPMWKEHSIEITLEHTATRDGDVDTIHFKNGSREFSVQSKKENLYTDEFEGQTAESEFVFNKKDVESLVDRVKYACLLPNSQGNTANPFMGVYLSNSLALATNKICMAYGYTKKDYGFKNIAIEISSWEYAMRNLHGETLIAKLYKNTLRLIDSNSDYANVKLYDDMATYEVISKRLDNLDPSQFDGEKVLQNVEVKSMLTALKYIMVGADQHIFKGWIQNGKIGSDNTLTDTSLSDEYAYTGDTADEKIVVNLAYIEGAFSKQFCNSSAVDFVFTKPFYEKVGSSTRFVKPLKITDGNTYCLIAPLCAD